MPQLSQSSHLLGLCNIIALCLTLSLALSDNKLQNILSFIIIPKASKKQYNTSLNPFLHYNACPRAANTPTTDAARLKPSTLADQSFLSCLNAFILCILQQLSSILSVHVLYVCMRSEDNDNGQIRDFVHLKLLNMLHCKIS